MAQNLDYNVNINTNQGIQNLDRLQSRLATLNGALGNLKGAIAGIAFGGFIANLYRSAAALDDMSKATGISIEKLDGFSRAVAYNGGQTQAALDSMGKFSQAIEGAAGGSAELQDKFLQLGISLKDLRDLSEEQLLDRVVQELGKGEGNANKMAIAMSLFGKNVRSVDFKGVAADIASMTAKAKEAAGAKIAAAEAEDRFSRAVSLVNDQILIALQPISELAIKILEGTSAISGFIKAAVQVAVVVASFTLIGKAVQLLRLAFVGVTEGLASVIGFSGGVANAFRNIAAIGERLFSGGIKTTFQTVGILLKEFGAWAVKAIPGLTALGAAIWVLIEPVKDLAIYLGRVVGLFKDVETSGEKSAKKAEDQSKKRSEAEKNAAREVQDAFKKQIAAIQEASKAFEDQNKKIIDQLSLETGLIGKSKEQSDILKSQAELYRRSNDEIGKLEKAKANLSKEEQRRGLGKQYDEQIAKIQELVKLDEELINQRYKELNLSEMTNQVRLFGIQNQIDKSNQLVALQDQMAKMTMNEIEQKYYDIEAAAKASAKAAIEAEEARVGRPLNAAERQKYYDESIKGTKELKAAQEELYVQSRKFDTGWAKALNEFTDNAMNAADKAYRVFQKMTSGMEDLIVNFAKTGKWEWRNFVNSIVEELLRSQIRTLMAQVFNLNRGVNTGGGGGGLLGGAIIPGFLAKGGPATANKPYIVGEKGPELFVPGTSGTVVPNNALVGNTSVTYNINAVDAMSFKQMIAADPSFIYAVTQQGAKSVPSTRR